MQHVNSLRKRLGLPTGWQTEIYKSNRIKGWGKLNLILRKLVEKSQFLWVYLAYGLRTTIACKVVNHTQLTLTFLQMLIWVIPFGLSRAVTTIVLDSGLINGPEVTQPVTDVMPSQPTSEVYSDYLPQERAGPVKPEPWRSSLAKECSNTAIRDVLYEKSGIHYAKRLNGDEDNVGFYGVSRSDLAFRYNPKTYRMDVHYTVYQNGVTYRHDVRGLNSTAFYVFGELYYTGEVNYDQHNCKLS